MRQAIWRIRETGFFLMIRNLLSSSAILTSILVEVNIAEEESKFGIHKEETISLIRQIAALPHIQILGLMTIAPFVENPEDNRTYFRQIRQLSVDIDAQNIDNVFFA